VRKISALLVLALIFLLLLPLGACNRENYFKLYGLDRDSLLYKITPREDEAFALHYVDLLRRSRFDEIEERLAPSVNNAQTRDLLIRLHSFFPATEAASIKTVSTAFARGDGGSTSSITLEYEFEPQVIHTNEVPGVTPRIWLLAQIVIQRRNGTKTIRGLTVFPIPKSFEEANEFTLEGAGISQYAGLSLALGVAGFTLYALVLCICSKIGKKKWIWLIPVLVGLLRVTVNWTSGQWTCTPLAVQIPPVNVAVEPYGPWKIIIFAPIGAIAFLLYRRSLPKAIATLSPEQSPSLDQLANT
jgi:hypothetical protein